MLSEILSRETCAECRFCCVFRRQSLWETPLLSEEFMKKYTKGADGNEVKYRKYVYRDDVINNTSPEYVRYCKAAEGRGAGMSSEDGMIYGQTELSHLYRTDDPEEEVPCPFLDAGKGCTLPEEDKPFDCKIWPLRLMRLESTFAVCLTPTCPAVNKLPLSKVRKLVENGLGEVIFAQGEKEPYMVKEYREGYAVLMQKNQIKNMD